MIYGYIRVSTDKQTVENQKFEILKFTKNNGLNIDKWVQETVSGSKDFNKRRLGVLIKKLKSEDILICTEISRLGRNLFQIMTILNICMQKNIKVWTIKDNYRLGTDIQSKVLAFAFSLSAEIERTLISQRTKEALALAKHKGKCLGRKTGSRNKYHILDGKEEKIYRLYNSGMPKYKIAATINVSPTTICNFLHKHPQRVAG